MKRIRRVYEGQREMVYTKITINILDYAIFDIDTCDVKCNGSGSRPSLIILRSEMALTSEPFDVEFAIELRFCIRSILWID